MYSRVHIQCTVLLKFILWLWTVTFAHLNNIWPHWNWMDATIWTGLWSCLYWYDYHSKLFLCLSLVHPVPRCVGGQPEACNFSLFSTLGVSRVEPCTSSDSISTPRSLSLLQSGQQVPPAITSGERKRNVSAYIKGNGKEKRKSLDGPQTTLVESLQRQTCNNSCKESPYGQVNVILYL